MYKLLIKKLVQLNTDVDLNFQFRNAIKNIKFFAFRFLFSFLFTKTEENVFTSPRLWLTLP